MVASFGLSTKPCLLNIYFRNMTAKQKKTRLNTNICAIIVQ